MEQHLYLAHHGIKGQKWGVRRFQNKDGTLTEAGKERYSTEQFERDAAIYGRGGARRIRRDVNKRGISVSGARSKEVDRINAARSRAKAAGQLGAMAGTVAGIVPAIAVSTIASRSVDKTLRGFGSTPMTALLASYTTHAAVSSGTIRLATTLGREGGRAVAMLSSGYSPAKYRSV